MNTRQQFFCAWCGPIFMVMFGLGFVVFAKFLPPLPPSMDMNAVAANYQNNTTGIQLGMCIAMMGTAFLLPWAGIISQQMLRIKGAMYVWAATQFGAGLAGALIIIIPCLLWIAATFRPERDPQLTYLVHDIAWIMFVLPSPMAFIQSIAIGVAILSDPAEKPVFPRWAGYLNLWIAVSFLPAPVAAFFKTGPFAWNGLFPFWIPLVGFSSWFVVMFVLLIRAIKEEEETSFCEQKEAKKLY